MARHSRQIVHRRKKGLKIGSFVPLTENDIGDFNSLDLDRMDVAELEKLRSRLQALCCSLACSEPADRSGVEYRFWIRRLSKAEGFLFDLQHLEAADPAREALEHFVVHGRADAVVQMQAIAHTEDSDSQILRVAGLLKLVTSLIV